MTKRIKAEKYKRLLRRAKYNSRIYNQCSRCGRRRGYVRYFGLCRICLRELGHKALIPGLRKSSW